MLQLSKKNIASSDCGTALQARPIAVENFFTPRTFRAKVPMLTKIWLVSTTESLCTLRSRIFNSTFIPRSIIPHSQLKPSLASSNGENLFDEACVQHIFTLPTHSWSWSHLPASEVKLLESLKWPHPAGYKSYQWGENLCTHLPIFQLQTWPNIW